MFDDLNKANVKAWFRWCLIDDREKFKESKCLAPISVGQKVHEGEKLYASLKRINSSFKECVLLIDDTIQRHTMKLELTSDIIIDKDIEEMLYQNALDEGDRWLERNHKIINSVEIPLKIIRWDKWLFHEKYSEQRKLIDNLYENNEAYANAINYTIDSFLERYLKRNSISISYKNAFSYCLDYIKEECTALCLWVEEGCHFEVYPSGRNTAMIATYDLLIKPFHPDLLKSVGLYYKKGKQNVFNSVNENYVDAVEL